MAKVLIVYYSQSGQLTRIAESIAEPLKSDPGISIHWEQLRPVRDYPFPWTIIRFFDTFPEAVWLDSPQLKPFTFGNDERFDLVIVAYTVWFLSPSPPIAAFLLSDEGRRVLRDTPVITVIACRNMWLMAQARTRRLLESAGARLIDSVVLVDRGATLATLITTPYWMFTGRQQTPWKLFAPAGIAPEDIAGAARFGRALAAAIRSGGLKGGQPLLRGLKACAVDDRLIASERIALRSFKIWGRLIRSAGRQGSPARIPILIVYVVFLVAMIVTVVPFTMAIGAVLRRILKTRIARQRARYESPSGSGAERIGEFER
jgi:hypothetical protein